MAGKNSHFPVDLEGAIAVIPASLFDCIQSRLAQQFLRAFKSCIEMLQVHTYYHSSVANGFWIRVTNTADLAKVKIGCPRLVSTFFTRC
jgi:hypothetical protein